MEDEENQEGEHAVDMEKKKILAILNNNLELQGDVYTVRLYSSERDGQNWLFSGIEGLLCLVLDFQVKTRYIQIYDPTNYQKVFQYELYNKFDKFFEELAPEFRSLEIEGGFIGLQFDEQDDAVQFERTMRRIAGFNSDFFNKPKTKSEDKKINAEKTSLYCKTLKKNFCTEEKYDENYTEDGMQVLKHRNFKVLNNITYDNDTKNFSFGKISDDLKEMFRGFGIKKKDLEQDAEFAFSLFKKVIVGLGGENKLKNSVLDNIQHTFLPPSERQEQRRQEEAAEQKMNQIKNRRNQEKKSQPKAVAKKPQRPAPARRGGGGSSAVPPPPPPLIVNEAKDFTKPPPLKVNQAKDFSSTAGPKKPETKSLSMADQLKAAAGGLKKVTKQEANKNIQGASKNFLQNALSTAIKNRRNNLHMHDDDEDEEDDDWD